MLHLNSPLRSAADIHFAYHYKNAESAAQLFEPLAHMARLQRWQAPLPRDGAWSRVTRALAERQALVVLWSDEAAANPDLRGLVALAVHRRLTVLIVRDTADGPEPPLGLPHLLLNRASAGLEPALTKLMADVRRRTREAPNVALPDRPRQPTASWEGQRAGYRHTLMGQGARFV